MSASPFPPEHFDESESNAWRRRLAEVECFAQRTYTPSLAVFRRSQGCYHYTPEGRKLADFTSGVLVTNLGHHPRRWWARVWDYLGLDPHGLRAEADYLTAAALNAYNAATEVEILAAERLLANLRGAPGGSRLERIVWAASGSEAIQKALWAALEQRPGADILLATRRGFHGKKGLAGAVTGAEDDPDRDPRVRFIDFPREACLSLQRRLEPLDLAPFTAELQRLAREHPGRICAIITEPYLGGGGSYHPQPEYLQLLQRFCREHGALFVLDEIQSGFGRTGPMYAFTRYGIEPDLVVLGKAMANGVPVAAVAGPAAVFARLHYGQASDTWSANPLAAAATLATLDEFEQTDVLTRGVALSQVLSEELQRLESLPAVAHVRGEGLVWGVECAAVGQRSAADVASRIVRDAYLGDDKGRAIHLLGPLAERVIRVSPPLVMPPSEAAPYLQALQGIVAGLA